MYVSSKDSRTLHRKDSKNTLINDEDGDDDDDDDDAVMQACFAMHSSSPRNMVISPPFVIKIFSHPDRLTRPSEPPSPP